MDDTRKRRLAHGLTSDDPRAVVEALDALRLLDLGQLHLLELALTLTDDARPAPGVAPTDPFSAFFASTPKACTVGEYASERLAHVGLPGFTGVADTLAAALIGAGPQRAAAVARLLAESPWDDRVSAVRTVLPGLIRADASLYALVVSAEDPVLEILVTAATAPFRARLVNELLNHEPARPPTVAALVEAVGRGTVGVDPSEALQVLGLLHQWREEVAGDVAATLARTHDWAIAFRGLHDPNADVAAWCRRSSPYPEDLPRVLQMILAHNDPRDTYPLREVLERLDGECGPVAAWDAVEGCAPLLRAWVERALRGDRPDRGWRAAVLLGPRLGEVGARVVAALGEGRVPLDPSLLEALDPVPGVDRALGQLARRHPGALDVVVPALLRTADDALLAEVADAVITQAEGAPVEIVPRRRGLVERRRQGIDVSPLEPIVARLGDPALRARWDHLLPVVGPPG